MALGVMLSVFVYLLFTRLHCAGTLVTCHAKLLHKSSVNFNVSATCNFATDLKSRQLGFAILSDMRSNDDPPVQCNFNQATGSYVCIGALTPCTVDSTKAMVEFNDAKAMDGTKYMCVLVPPPPDAESEKCTLIDTRPLVSVSESPISDEGFPISTGIFIAVAVVSGVSFVINLVCLACFVRHKMSRRRQEHDSGADNLEPVEAAAKMMNQPCNESLEAIDVEPDSKTPDDPAHTRNSNLIILVNDVEPDSETQYVPALRRNGDLLGGNCFLTQTSSDSSDDSEKSQESGGSTTPLV